MNLRELQEEVAEWSAHNFPNNKPYHPLLGVVEEAGELSLSIAIGKLCHAHLKHEQRIRGYDSPIKALEDKVDAIGDIIIYLADYCGRNGIDLEQAVTDTWITVKRRNWRVISRVGVDP